VTAPIDYRIVPVSPSAHLFDVRCLVTDCSRDALPRPGEKDVSEDYRGFLALASHEYFHAWNVKRIVPQAFLFSCQLILFHDIK